MSTSSRVQYSATRTLSLVIQVSSSVSLESASQSPVSTSGYCFSKSSFGSSSVTKARFQSLLSTAVERGSR